MTRLLILLAGLILYVAPPVAQAFATSHVRPPDTALVQPTSANTEGTSSTDTENPRGTFGAFLTDYHEAFRTYGLIVGGVAGLIFAFWRARIATRQAEAAAARADAAIEQARAANEQARAANEQARIAEQGHITERFSRAVEHLGHDRVAVRIGGIYALKRIAEDSVARDHLAVMDVLTNFIRQPPYTNEQRANAERARKLMAGMKIAAAAAHTIEPELIDCPDIVAAIEIIQGRSEGQREVEAECGYRLSLSRANLSYFQLSAVDLRYFDLAGANLTSADLTDAKLTGAKLAFAKLTDADVLGADLTSADLTGADLKRANLSRVKLKRADLTAANLTGADLWNADLTGAKLLVAELTDADLTGAKLTGATNLTQVQLDSACIPEGGEPPALPEDLKPPQKVCKPR